MAIVIIPGTVENPACHGHGCDSYNEERQEPSVIQIGSHVLEVSLFASWVLIEEIIDNASIFLIMKDQ